MVNYPASAQFVCSKEELFNNNWVSTNVKTQFASLQLWKSNADFNMSPAMYHLFSCPIATHLSRLFIAAVPSRLRVLPELDFWGFSLRRRGAVLLRLTSLLSFRACRSRAHALGNKCLLVLSLPGPQWKEPSNKCVVSTRSSFGDRFLVLFPVLCWLICKPLNPSVFISFSTLCGSATWQAFLTNKGFAISEPLFRKKKM